MRTAFQLGVVDNAESRTELSEILRMAFLYPIYFPFFLFSSNFFYLHSTALAVACADYFISSHPGKSELLLERLDSLLRRRDFLQEAKSCFYV